MVPERGMAVSARDVRVWSLWLGFLAGLVEALRLAGSHHGAEVRFNPDAPWMALAVDLLWMGFVGGLGASTLSALWPRRFPPRAALVWVAFAFWVPLLLLVHWFHPLAVVVLAAGLAVRTASWMARDPQRVRRWVRGTTPAFLLIALGLGAAPYRGSWPWRGQVRSEASPPPRAAPNVLILLIDAGAASHFSLYGYPRPTSPALEALALEGTVFEQAAAPASWTLPSHAALFTGDLARHVLPTGQQGPLLREAPTLAEAFLREGYATAAFFGNAEYGHPRWGLDRGFERYSVVSRSAGELFLASSLGRYLALSRRARRLLGIRRLIARRSASSINEEFLDWLDRIGGDRPFFAFLNYFDAHVPYDPVPDLERRFRRGSPRRFEWIEWGIRSAWFPLNLPVAPGSLAGEIDAYDAAIASIDAEISRLLEELRRRRVLDRTIVVVTSDHGEAFGEHGRAGHGLSLYEEELWVPLVLRYPRAVPAGLRVHEPVSVRSVASTVADLAGLRARFPGPSLRGVWGGALTRAPVVAEVVAFDGQELESTRAGRMKYIRARDPAGNVHEEAYDLGSDPGEFQNLLAAGQERVPVIAALRASLDSALASPVVASWRVPGERGGGELTRAGGGGPRPR
jgi:arylsulfatase A-like enzyme